MAFHVSASGAPTSTNIRRSRAGGCSIGSRSTNAHGGTRTTSGVCTSGAVHRTARTARSSSGTTTVSFVMVTARPPVVLELSASIAAILGAARRKPFRLMPQLRGVVKYFTLRSCLS